MYYYKHINTDTGALSGLESRSAWAIFLDEGMEEISKDEYHTIMGALILEAKEEEGYNEP